MPRYKTKPCVIEAKQYTGDNIDEIIHFTEGQAHRGFIQNWDIDRISPRACLVIDTLEGRMEASVGDYIIRGLRGEYYPCKEDVFHKKYEILED